MKFQQAVNLKIVRLAYWLIRLRWYAIAGIGIAYFLAISILNITILLKPVIVVVVVLILLNITSFLLLKYLQKSRIRKSLIMVRRIINFQISTDLIMLTILLHFSGGVENPFIIYYIFHMIIGSIVLTNRESYLQTSFALLLVGTMTFLEYTAIIKHYPLDGFIITNMYNNLIYIVTTGFIFISTSYFVVYITKSIILDSKKHENAYLQANIKLKQKDRIKNEYVMRITHDIKGHITAIHSCLSILNKKITGELSPQQEEFVNRAYYRIEILNKFISDRLNITKRKVNQKTVRADFKLLTAITNVIKIAENEAADKNIRIILQAETAVKIIYGEQTSIEEVLLNLILNAVKYSPEGEEVIINLKDKGNRVLIEVSDKGIGIPEAELEMIFSEFYRASNTKNHDSKGTGLGLAISKQIVESHSGMIWAVSELNKGSTFTVELRKER